MSMVTRFVVCGIWSAVILQGCKTDKNFDVATTISSTKSKKPERGSETSNTRSKKPKDPESEKSHHASSKNDLRDNMNTQFTDVKKSVADFQKEADVLTKQLEEATKVHENTF